MTHSTNSQTSIWKFLFGHERNESEIIPQPTGPFILPSIRELILVPEPIEPIEIIDDFDKCTPKKSTSTLDSNAIDLLEDYFQTECKPPTSTDLEHLAKKTGLTKTQVENWIRNNRSRRRKRLTPLQEIILEDIFIKNKKSVKKHVQIELAREFDVHYRHIKYWFCNRRAGKKYLEDSTNQSLKYAPYRHFDPVIRGILECEFEQNKYPDKKRMEYLMSQTGLTKLQLKNWFSSRRYRIKRNRIN